MALFRSLSFKKQASLTTEVAETKPLSKWSLPQPSVDQIYKHKIFFSLRASTIYHETQGTYRIQDSHEDRHFLHLLEEIQSYREKSIKKGYNFVHLGYCMIGIVPLLKKGINASALGILLDTRHKNFNDQMIAVIEGPLSNGPIYLECFSNFVVSLTDPYFTKVLTFMFKTHGLDMKRSSEHVQIAYRLVVRLVNTNLPSVYNGLSISENQNDKGQNTIVKVDSLSQMQTPVIIQWDQVTFPDNWDINIHPTLINEVHAPSHIEAHRLGHTDQYKIVSSRLLEYRSQLARQCVPSSSIAPYPSSIASTSSRPISVPLHCAHNDYVLIEEKPRCKHCNKLLQHISTVNAITVLTSETLAVRHEVSSSASNILSAIDPSHKVLNWQSNALKDLAEMNQIQQQLLHNLSVEVQALKLDLS